MDRSRARLLVLSDRPDTVFGHVARELAAAASRVFDVDLRSADRALPPDWEGYDLIHFCCWWDDACDLVLANRERVILHVGSLDREEARPRAALEAGRLSLRDGLRWDGIQGIGLDPLLAERAAGAGMVLAAGADLLAALRQRGRRVRRLDMGVDPAVFHPAGRPASQMKAGGTKGGEMKIGIVSGRGSRALAGTWPGASLLEPEADVIARRDFFRAHEVVVAVDDDFRSRLCLVEAMACGAFVIAGRHAADLLANGVSGLVVANDPDEIGAGLRWISGDAQAIADGAAIAAQEAMVGFNWGIVGDAYVGMLWEHLCRLQDRRRAERRASRAA